jgi:hypothetical protein
MIAKNVRVPTLKRRENEVKVKIQMLFLWMSISKLSGRG